MKLKTIPYSAYEAHLPQKGQYILAQQRANTLIVYQAFNPRIAEYAVKHQQFGGPHYSFNRMSWIKPNFLWMMFRCGWAQKENQERVLAIEIQQSHFDAILTQAVHSSFKAEVYSNREEWKKALQSSEVRLQWDPDHDPKGNKLERRAIQLGLKGEILRQFATDWIVSIEDITGFVREGAEKVGDDDMEGLGVMEEEVYAISSEELRRKLLLAE